MTYEPTVWKDGDLVTSAKLNKLEQGVANGGGTLIVNLSINESQVSGSGMPPMICNKTAGEIYEAFRNDNVKFIFKPVDYFEAIMNLTSCNRSPAGYFFIIFNPELNNFTLHAATADDYPTYEESESEGQN